MKSCPECKRTFEDTFTFCLVDGSILSAPFDPAATLTLPSPATEAPSVESSGPQSKSPPPKTIAAQRPAEPPATLVSQPTAAPFASAARETATDFSTAKRKPNYAIWIAAVLGVIVISAIGLTFLLLKKSSDTRWEDTEANRQADRKAGVAARVNGKPITQADVDKVVSQQTRDSTNKLSALELQQARLQILDSLIQREALVQRAEKEKVLPTEEQVTAIIEKQKKDSGMTEVQFQTKLKEQNLTPDALREEARRDLAIQALQDKHATVSVTDKEIEDFYNANRKEFVNERGAGLSVIVVDPADNSSRGLNDDAKSDGDAKVKIDNIANELRSGADFATTARAKSEDADSLTKGGDIGYFSEAKLRETGFPQNLIARFMGPMAIGDITEPLLLHGKWYIFKLTQRHLTTENLTLESPGVRDQIKEGLTNQRKELLSAQLLTSTMNETKVVNYLAAG